MRKLEDQNEYESRCLWKDVTFNLKIRDIDVAAEARYRLEERQRAEAQKRKEKEIQWETRLFHEDGECWVYVEPLLKHVVYLNSSTRMQSLRLGFIPWDLEKEQTSCFQNLKFFSRPKSTL